MKKYYGAVILFSMCSLTYGAYLSAAAPHQCAELMNSTAPFILVIKKDESLVDSILNCATHANLNNASLSGLGAIQNPKLGYYNLSNKKYQYKSFKGIYELTSLNGNITYQNGKLFAHIHVNLSDDSYHVLAGHLDSAKVGATTEITIAPLPHPVRRAPDNDTGLQLINTGKT